jgi:uncharacterized RDD family membrane protein YckC
MSNKLDQIPAPPPDDENPSRAVLLARLAVGAISYGMELLDTQVSGPRAPVGGESAQSQSTAVIPRGGEGEPSETVISTQSVSIRAAQVKIPASTPRSRSQADIDLQNTLVGLMIASARGIDRATDRVDRATRFASRTMDPWVAPVVNSRIFRPLRKSWEGWVARGQKEVDAWKQIGAEETTRGQELLEDVTMSTVNASIDYITVQPKVTDLVTHQTTTLTYAVLTTFRGILFNLDFIIEGLLRRLLRMTPRKDIPGPPRDIRERGVTGLIKLNEKPDVDAPGSWAGYYAGFASRTTSFIIDITLLAVVMSLLAFFTQQVLNFVQAGMSLLRLNVPLDQLMEGGDPVMKFLVSSLSAYILFVLYHMIAWSISGATIGDAMSGLRVVTIEANLPNAPRALLRVTFGYTISFLLLGFGFLMVLWTPRRRGLHDHLFRTFKVYSWDAHPSDLLMKAQERKKLFANAQEGDSEDGQAEAA